MKNISEYIAPWALANEKIPLSLVWEDSEEYDIKVRLPVDFTIEDFFNVDKFELVNDNTAVIHKLKTPNYFGLVFLCKRTYKEQLEQKEVKIEFWRSNKIEHIHTLYTRIVRPILKIIEAPKEVVISSQSKFEKLFTIIAQYKGMGKAQTKIEMLRKGDFITRDKSIYGKLIKEFFHTQVFKDILVEDGLPDAKDVQIDHQFIKTLAKEAVTKLLSGKLEMGLTKSETEFFRKWISESKGVAKIYDYIYSRIENLVLHSLVYYLNKNPSDNIELIHGTPTMYFKGEIKWISVVLHYNDSAGNEYEPQKIDISVKDQRRDKERVFEGRIDVKWKHEFLKL